LFFVSIVDLYNTIVIMLSEKEINSLKDENRQMNGDEHSDDHHDHVILSLLLFLRASTMEQQREREGGGERKKERVENDFDR
jgi:hypothetical protein